MEEKQENVSKSAFNDALRGVLRQDESWRLINTMWISPLQQFENDKFGYEIISSELFNLMTEVWGKLTAVEKKECDEARDEIIIYLSTKRIHTYKWSQTFAGRKKVTFFSQGNWESTRTLLFKFQKRIRELYEIHEMSSPNKEQEGDWD